MQAGCSWQGHWYRPTWCTLEWRRWRRTRKATTGLGASWRRRDRGSCSRERGSGGRVAVQERRGEEHRSGQELREPQSRGRVRAPAALLPVQLCAPFPQVRILPCTLVSETQRPPSGTRVNAHSFSPFVHSMEV